MKRMVLSWAAVLMLAAGLFAGCTAPDESVYYEPDPEVAGADYLRLDEVTVVAQGPVVVLEEVVVTASGPGMVVDEVLVNVTGPALRLQEVLVTAARAPGQPVATARAASEAADGIEEL